MNFTLYRSEKEPPITINRWDLVAELQALETNDEIRPADFEDGGPGRYVYASCRPPRATNTRIIVRTKLPDCPPSVAGLEAWLDKLVKTVEPTARPYAVVLTLLRDAEDHEAEHVELMAGCARDIEILVAEVVIGAAVTTTFRTYPENPHDREGGSATSMTRGNGSVRVINATTRAAEGLASTSIDDGWAIIVRSYFTVSSEREGEGETMWFACKADPNETGCVRPHNRVTALVAAKLLEFDDGDVYLRDPDGHRLQLSSSSAPTSGMEEEAQD